MSAPRLALGLGLVMVVLAATWGWKHRPYDDQRPLAAPATFAGWPESQRGQTFASDPAWLSTVEEDLPGTPATAFRGYEVGGPAGPIIANLVLTRTDLTGRLDVGLATEPVTEYGAVSCSRTLKLSVTGDAAPVTSPRMLVCWRTSRELSASVFVIGSDLPGGDLGVAQALDAAWRAQG